MGTVVDEAHHMPRVCTHPRLVDVRSEGGAVIGYQCSRCPKIWGHCSDCGTPLDEGHDSRRTGCLKCGRGRFCSVKTRLCPSCSPAPDGVCRTCKSIFPQTGRQVLARKCYCSRSCQERARRQGIIVRPDLVRAVCSPA